jgi:hypothetical protein
MFRPCEAETCRRLIEYKKWMCYIDGQKNKYSLYNVCAEQNAVGA